MSIHFDVFKNMDEFKSIKEVSDYNLDTKDEKVVSKQVYAYIVIHGNKKRYNLRT